jgi:hypothetical protein
MDKMKTISVLCRARYEAQIFPFSGDCSDDLSAGTEFLDVWNRVATRARLKEYGYNLIDF